MTEDLIATWFPHGYCLAWDWRLITLNAAGDLATFLSYSVLAFLIARAWLQNNIEVLISKETAPMWATFIFACGMTHLTSIFTTWQPIYFMETFFMIINGLVSAVTAWIAIIDSRKAAAP